MSSILNSGIKLVRNVSRYNIGPGSLGELNSLLYGLRQKALESSMSSDVIFLIDRYFEGKIHTMNGLSFDKTDYFEFISVDKEPTTSNIDNLLEKLISLGYSNPAAIVGIGGGITMDTAKALSNMLTNGGSAANYQGWDLVKRPGIFKIGVPTISGTGAEATRTCVMTNPSTGLKLGMNSDYTVFDHVIMDSNLTATVPRNQYFYTGMDSYIHCVEVLNGSFRNSIGDAYSRETIELCRQVFSDGDMQSPTNREKLMVASYLGGCAVATSYVGLIHPLSAALSVVLGTHHCVGNCIVMGAMADYYPAAYQEFMDMVERNKVQIPSGICRNLDSKEFDALYEAAMMHEKPLTNALGVNFRSILTLDHVTSLFKKM